MKLISNVLEKIGLTTTRTWCVPHALTELYGIEYSAAVKMIRQKRLRYQHWWTPVKGINSLDLRKMIADDFDIESYESHFSETTSTVPKFKDWKFKHFEGTYLVNLQSFHDIEINNSHAIIFKNGIVRDNMICHYLMKQKPLNFMPYDYDGCFVIEAYFFHPRLFKRTGLEQQQRYRTT